MGEEHCARADPAAPAAGHPAAGWGSTGHPAAGWGSGPPLPSTPSAAVLAPPSPRPPHPDNPLQGQASWGGHLLPNRASRVPCTFLGTAPFWGRHPDGPQDPALAGTWQEPAEGLGWWARWGTPPPPQPGLLPAHHRASCLLGLPRGDLCCHPVACGGSAGGASPLQPVLGLSKAANPQGLRAQQGGRVAGAGSFGRTSGSQTAAGAARPGAVLTAPSSG